MYIKRIRIENLKGFRDGEFAVDLDLQRPNGKYAGWTVLAGRNASGKSTLLRAIALALACHKGVYSLQKSLNDWVGKGATGGWVDLKLTVEKNDKFMVAKYGNRKEVEDERLQGFRVDSVFRFLD